MEHVSGYKTRTHTCYTDFLNSLSHATTVLTPTRRLATRLHKDYAYHQQQQQKTVWQIDIISLSGYIERLWQTCQDDETQPVRLRLNSWQNQLLWQDIVNQHTDDALLLRKEKMAALAEQAWGLLKEWGLNWRVLETSDSPDVQAFINWCAIYETRCAALDICDAASVSDYLLQAIHEKIADKIYLLGFTDFSPKITALLQHLRKYGTVIECLAYREAQNQVYCAPQTDANTELTQAALWAQSLLTTAPDHPIGIVVPNLAARWHEVERIFSNVLMPQSVLANYHDVPKPFNISAGRKLADFPIITIVFELLNMNPYAMLCSRLSQILLSPFIAQAETECFERQYLDFCIRQLAQEKIIKKNLFTHCPPNTCVTFMQMITPAPIYAAKTLHLPSEWCKHFKKCLAHWGWPGERVLSSLEYQVVCRFHELLSDFSNLDVLQQPISYRAACQLLAQQAQALLFQGESEDKPIQILGTLEAAGLYFHALWVTGLHNENWPQACTPHPLLPALLQREWGMPHASAEREYRFAQDLTQRFSEQAAHVIFSYPVQENDKRLMPSSLITAYPLLETAFTAATDLFATAPLETWQETAVALRKNTAHVSGGAGLLQAQAACPFQAFARYRLQARAFETPHSGLSAQERGQLVHAALDFFWKEVRSFAQLVQLSSVQCEALIETAVTQALAQLAPDIFCATHLAIEKIRLQALLFAWQNFEKTRTPFTVVASEEKVTVELAGLSLRLRIDRMDKLDSGEIVLLDYKTGQVNAPDWLSERPTHVQLPLYAVSYKTAQGVAFAAVKANHFKFTGLSASENQLPGVKAIAQTPLNIEWPEILAHWQQTLHHLAQAFVAGEAHVSPLEGDITCNHCDLALLCRIGSQS